MDNIIITINRECGSGGGEIARILGKKLGLKVYGRTILENVAQQLGLTLETMDQVKAKKNNWWSEFCRFYQQFGAISYTPGEQPEITPMSVYLAEARLLRELAEQESCIIIGRAGFHIFRDYPNSLHILIIADHEARVNRIAQKQNITNEEAAQVIDSVDRARDTFVKNVADTSRNDAHNYNLTINVTNIPPEQVATLLADHIRNILPRCRNNDSCQH